MEIRQQKAVYGKIQHLYSLNKKTGIEQWCSKYSILTFCIKGSRHLYIPYIELNRIFMCIMLNFCFVRQPAFLNSYIF